MLLRSDKADFTGEERRRVLARTGRGGEALSDTPVGVDGTDLDALAYIASRALMDAQESILVAQRILSDPSRDNWRAVPVLEAVALEVMEAAAASWHVSFRRAAEAPGTPLAPGTALRTRLEEFRVSPGSPGGSRSRRDSVAMRGSLEASECKTKDSNP